MRAKLSDRPKQGYLVWKLNDIHLEDGSKENQFQYLGTVHDHSEYSLEIRLENGTLYSTRWDWESSHVLKFMNPSLLWDSDVTIDG
jgi:hypothetical protein